MIFLGNTKKQNQKFKLKMTRDGLIAYDKATPMTVRFNHDETKELFKKNFDFSKYDHHCEVAHLEITNRCNMSCKHCYVTHKNKGVELNKNGWRIIIKNLAASGVFQVSFGGGEPTLRKDLFVLAKYVHDSGMNLGMTTNGTTITRLNPKKLRKYFKQINISWHRDQYILDEALKFLKKHKIPSGINYCYSKQEAIDNTIVGAMAKYYGAELLYLVYKPVINDWENQIPGEEVLKQAKKSAEMGIRTAVDGPCVNKCLMKKKFVDVDSFGNVYPCSFVRKPIGNILNMDFKTIWRDRGPQDECPFVKLIKEEEGVKV